MKRIHKRLSFIVSFLLVFSLFVPSMSFAAHDPNSKTYDYGVEFWDDDTPDVGFYINAAANYSLLQVDEPNFGTFAGEWTMMNLLRGLYTESDYINQIPNGYFEGYKYRVENYVNEKDGNLDRNKSTEWSRAILSLTAMDSDITKVGQHDFIKRLSESHRFSHRQGINGPIWILLSLNTGRNKLYTTEEYIEKYGEIPDESDYNTEGKLIDFIIDREIPGGGWALWGNNPDPDITGMALQSLAHYYLEPELFNSTDSKKAFIEFAASVERGIVALEKMQLEDGSYPAFGNTNSESTVQAIVALTELQIDPLATNHYLPHIKEEVSFTTQGMFQDGIYTNNMIDALLTFWADRSYKTKAKDDNEYYAVGGFRHIKSGYDGGGGSGAGVNAMATDQALYGLIAYDRFLHGENSLYDMRDMMDKYSGKGYKTFKAEEFNLNFYSNGDEKETAKVSPYQIIKLPQLKTEGKTHIGWAKQADGKGKTFKPGARLSIPSKHVVKEGSLDLYAIYDVEQYNLTLHPDGGTYDLSKIPGRITVDDKIELPDSNGITKKGYKFDGWYTTASLTGDAIEEISHSNSDVDLYAKWTALEVDTQVLDKLLDKAKSLDTEGYTEASVIHLNETISQAENVSEQASDQEAVDSMTEDLNQAMEDLIVDKTELQKKIKEAEDLLK